MLKSKLWAVLCAVLSGGGFLGSGVSHAQAPSPQPASPASVEPTAILWEVHNRFRLFRDQPEVVALADKLLSAIDSHSDLQSAYPDFRAALQGLYPDQLQQGSPDHRVNLYQHTRYNRGPGTYGPLPGEAPYLVPAEQTIVAWLPAAMPTGSRCSWSVDGVEQQHEIDCAASAQLHLRFPKGTFIYLGAIDVHSGGAMIAHSAVRTSDILVLSLGDSFAAGEGSPDRPTDVRRFSAARSFDPSKPYLWWKTTDDKVHQGGVLPEEASADWWSLECHRSLFSPHALAAMKMAASDHHDSVTYFSYACAGASVLDGLLTKQAQPPGLERIRRLGEAHPGQELPEGLAAERSQLERAVADLCATEPDTVEYPFNTKRIQNWNDILTHRAQNTFPKVPTCHEWRRRPEYIMLTIGGNDVGFAGLGAWALTPSDFVNIKGLDRTFNAFLTNVASRVSGDLGSWNGMALVCPSQPYGTTWISGWPILGNMIGSDPRCNVPPMSTNLGAKHLVEEELPYLLQIAQDFISTSGIADEGVVIQESYPSPLRDENGVICGKKSGVFASDDHLREPWLAEEAQIPARLTRLGPVPIYLREDADLAVERTAFTGSLGHRSLLDQIQATERPGWRVTRSPVAFARHGICATSSNLRDPFTLDWAFPRWKAEPAPGTWDWSAPSSPPRPSAWEAYASRARWLRTANDSLLTEAAADASGNILDESLNGAIHPTAEGQASVADEILKRVVF